jgi:hypothetical protein
MKRATKSLPIGLSLIAALLLTVAATAAAAEFEPSKTGTVKLTGSGNQTLTLPAGKVICGSLKGSIAVTTAKITSLLLLATYSKCEAFG